MNDLTTQVLMEQRLQRLRELQDQRTRRTRPVNRPMPPTHRRYQRRR
ncbi:MAG: hypothetical protein AAGE98_14160 [Actinomycetota bacterium]